MSQENVEIARALLARWERGDYVIAEAFDPEVEFTRTGGGSDVLGYVTKSYGFEGFRGALGAWTEEWSDVRVQAETFIEVGERVRVLVRHRAVGKRSGVPMNHIPTARRDGDREAVLRQREMTPQRERNHDAEVPTDDEEVPVANGSGAACCCRYGLDRTGSGQRQVGTHASFSGATVTVTNGEFSGLGN